MSHKDTTQEDTHGASCICAPCMERSDRAFTVWYDSDEADPAASVVAQAFTEDRCRWCGALLASSAERVIETCNDCFFAGGDDTKPPAATASEPAWRPTTPSATTRDEPPLWQHRPPTCGRCGARMRLPRHPAGDGWTWGAFGWQHDCGWHR